MNQLLPMRTTLVELEKAIDARDVLKMGQTTGRLYGPLCALSNEPRPTDAAKQKQWDSLAGPCLLLITRCQEKLKALPPISGLRGVPFEPVVVSSMLTWAVTVIDPAGRIADSLPYAADSPTPLETPTPPTPADDSPKPG